jgi:hypothetical protein
VPDSMQIFARLVRLLLGSTAIADRKLEQGSYLTVLGMTVCPTWNGIRFNLCREKADKWLNDVSMALKTGFLSSGEAQKLSGRLGWSTQSLFFRLQISTCYSPLSLSMFLALFQGWSSNAPSNFCSEILQIWTHLTEVAGGTCMVARCFIT